MQGKRLKAMLALGDHFGMVYEFVKVEGLSGAERFYISSTLGAVSGYLKLQSDLGEDHFPYITYRPLEVEEILALNRRNKLPQLTENMIGGIFTTNDYSEVRVKLIGQTRSKK